MKSQIRNVILKYGEPIEFYPRQGQAVFLTASVQRPIADPLVNDYDQDAFLVYIAADDLNQEPTKFDRVRVRGDLRTIEEVQIENAKGVVLVYMLRIRG